MFYLLNFIGFCMLILNWMSPTHFKLGGTEATEAWDNCRMLKKTPVRHIPQVNRLTATGVMIGYESGIHGKA